MRILVTSASGLRPDRRTRPGGGTFGPRDRYYLGTRRRRTILAVPAALDGEGASLLPDDVVPFPRGFGFGRDGALYLASGPYRRAEATTRSSCSTAPEPCARRTGGSAVDEGAVVEVSLRQDLALLFVLEQVRPRLPVTLLEEDVL